MTTTKQTITVDRAVGEVVTGEVVCMTGGFSPRYHLNRVTGKFSVQGNPVDGTMLSCKSFVCDYARGGMAAGWALNMLKDKDFAAIALIFMKANPVMVQGSIFANITIAEGFRIQELEKLQNSSKITLNPEVGQIVVEA